MSEPQQEEELALGDRVTIEGTVIASTRFAGGGVTYLVEYERKGRTVSEWFALDDLDLDGEAADGGEE
jgi:hypothetical protein